jgi:hypothetical protein
MKDETRKAISNWVDSVTDIVLEIADFGGHGTQRSRRDIKDKAETLKMELVNEVEA